MNHVIVYGLETERAIKIIRFCCMAISSKTSLFLKFVRPFLKKFFRTKIARIFEKGTTFPKMDIFSKKQSSFLRGAIINSAFP